MMRPAIRKVYALLAVGLLAGLVLGCSDDDRQPPPPSFGDLGGVVVGAGEAVQLRSLLSHTGWKEPADASRIAIEIAVRDFGDIHGHDVALGTQLNEMCTPAGGAAGAEQIIADAQVVGVIGTSCSGAGAAASALLSAAGLVMISPSNTSPSLTSDLEGNANANNYPGYFRISNNDLYTGRAVADFAYNELGLRSMGIVDIDDAYIEGLANAFRDAFEGLGGEVVATARIEFGQTDMTAALTALAAAGPEGIFFPLYDDEGIPFVKQARELASLDAVELIAADGVLVTAFLETPESEGVYMAGPVLNFPGNVNAVTGQNEAAVRQAADATYGDPLRTLFWQHAYDATTLLLDAIQSVAEPQGGVLHVDRAALRQKIGETAGFQGLTGMISCDAFGDCGTGRTDIYHHADLDVTDPAEVAVDYEFMP